MVFFGCTFVAFGPSLAMFWFTIMKYPLRIILVVIGAFCWLLALLLSSLWWLAVVPLKEQLAFALVFSVIFQEAARFALFKILDKAHEGLDEALSEEEKNSIAGIKLSYVSGFGFGLMAGLFSIVNVLSNAIGPGNVGINGSSSNFSLTSSFLTNAIILLHTFWNILLFHGFKKKKWLIIGFVVGLHMLVSCISLLNSHSEISYISVLVSYGVLLFCGLWAFARAGGSSTNIVRSFTTHTAINS